ncbi:MAG: glycolate oxidase subunit GlcF [Acidiferrobacteraceae bacterium]
MQTTLPESLRARHLGQTAESALRACVHCGFCNSVCPTYQILGDETDSPRGRIYLIKNLLEGHADADIVRRHLDRCLTCRACERQCPSGVPYSKLLEAGRETAEAGGRRTLGARAMRQLLRSVFPYRARTRALFAAGRLVAPVLPLRLKRMLQDHAPQGRLRQASRSKPTRRAVLFTGCVQDAARPGINRAAAGLLDRLGWSFETDPGGCCGALSHHLSAGAEAERFMRANIDAWWPLIENGLDALVVTASGCGAMLSDYGRLLAHDPAYAEKAAAVASRVRDLSTCISADDLTALQLAPDSRKIALHRPCTLEHALNLGEHLETLLRAAGFDLVQTAPDLACCGSAGTYSLLEPVLAHELLRRKLIALGAENVDLILTSNIGCELHLASGSKVPVQHWALALAQRLPG